MPVISEGPAFTRCFTATLTTLWFAIPELALESYHRDTIRYTIYLITPELALENYHRDTTEYTICLATPESALENYHGGTIGTTFVSRYENYHKRLP